MTSPVTRIWRASGGRNIRMCDLTPEHLINILNWIERGPQIPNWRQYVELGQDSADDYFWLRQEAMRRGLRWRRWSRMSALQDGDLFGYVEPRSDSDGTVALGSLKPGDAFTYPLRSNDKYFVCKLHGVIRNALDNFRGYTVWQDERILGDHDEVWRRAVVRLNTGAVYLAPEYWRVVKINDN